MPTPRKTVSAPHRAGGLHPGGTARALFQGEESDEALPRSLWEHLRTRDVGQATLLSAWEVARWVAAPTAERKAFACLLVALGEAVAAGSSSLPLRDTEGDDGLTSWLGRLGLGDGERGATVALAAALADGRASPAIAAMIATPDLRRPLVVDDGRLYPEALASAETHLAALLAARLRARPAPIQVPPRVPSPSERATSPEQQAAIQACLTQALTLITGGPGTGKTSIIVSVLRALAHAGVPPEVIAVAAPTGRAAQRIDESIQGAGLVSANATAPATATLHRLLGVRPTRLPNLEPDTPEFHAGWRLPQRFVIVDEASMIDLFMMTDLLSALADDAHLILLGDADQLPAVRLGAVFRDLCAALPSHTWRLTRSFRMDPADPAGAEILRVAQGLGADAPATFPTRADVAALQLTGVEHIPRPLLPSFLNRWYGEVLGGDAVFAALSARRFTPAVDGTLASPDDADGVVTAALARHAAARILCLTRVADSAASAEAVNALLHQLVLRARGLTAVETAATERARRFLPGEPVAVLRNDYERGLWNGDQGVVLGLTKDPGSGLGVAFLRAGRIVVHALDELTDNVELAFALTVHKAQGSEYDRIAVVLPSTDGPLLSREILYTALTRARRGVLIAGDPALFALGARRRLRRASGLLAKLRVATAAT